MPNNIKGASQHDLLKNQILSGPIPGESWTHAPKSMPYEKPPQFTDVEGAMNFLMDQLTESSYMKQMLGLMDAGMPIEAIARSIIFIGFTVGKWTPDVGMLMYKPTILALMAIAHRTGMHDTPVTMPQSLDKYIKGQTRTTAMINRAKGSTPKSSTPSNPLPKAPSLGFMNRGVR